VFPVSDEPKDHEEYLARAVFSPKYAAALFAKIAPLLAKPEYAKSFYQALADHGIRGFDIPSSGLISTKD
jgi:hypothetical protein